MVGRSLLSVSANVPGVRLRPTLADVAAPPEPVWSNHAGFGFLALPTLGLAKMMGFAAVNAAGA
jgi:hypothetical protein